MKLTLTIILLCSLHCAGQQYTYILQPDPPDTHLADWKREMDARRTQLPPDPWRTINGQLCTPRGPGFNDFFFSEDPDIWKMRGKRPLLNDGWYLFNGTVIEVQSGGGLRVQGQCTYFGEQETIFYVSDWPFEAAQGERLGWRVAKYVGIHSYNNVGGSVSTLREFAYGVIASAPQSAPLTAEQLDASKKAAEQAVKDGQAALLKADRAAADKGDAGAQRRMGERYRDGDGVKRSLDAAGVWLAMAAQHGDAEAARELKDLKPASADKSTASLVK